MWKDKETHVLSVPFKGRVILVVSGDWELKQMIGGEISEMKFKDWPRVFPGPGNDWRMPSKSCR